MDVSELRVKHNKFAKFKFNIDHTYEAGIVLTGSDVKSIRANKFEIREAFVREENGELFVWNIIFSDKENNIQKRKLLLHRNEIDKILVLLKDRKIHGYVLGVKFNDKNRIKFEIGVGSVKKARDKSASEKRSSEKRQLERDMKISY